MLVIVTSFITIALTYFQLAIEDHRWWWRSIFSGGTRRAITAQFGRNSGATLAQFCAILSDGPATSTGSTGFFVYAYCFFYYFERSGMFGFMQTSFFFGYMLMASYAAFIMLGTIGFLSSLAFVRRIYAAIKCD